MPDDPTKRALNTVVHSVGILIYSAFLIWCLCHIVIFLIIKKRYKDYSIVLYYIFFVSLFLSRII